MTSGRLITFEGIDGSGKTTQALRIQSDLERAGRQVLYLREPGGTRIGERIRAILLDRDHVDMSLESEILLFAAARAQIVRELVLPALQEGTIVLLDRFTDSTVAYQGYGRGIPLDTAKALNRFAAGSLEPDLTFLIDLPVDVALSRTGRRTGQVDRLDVEDTAFHERVRQGYLRMAEENPRRFRVLDGEKDEDSLALDIQTILKEGIVT